MPTAEDFVGSAFFLERAAVLGPATIRLTFAQDPKTVSSTASDDGLNPSNYDLIGPDGNYVTSVGDVTDDPQSVDLFLAAPLEAGVWTITVVNVKSDTGTSLTSPTALTFSADAPATQALLSGGALSDDAFAVLRRHFNPALRGVNWNAVLTGLAAGDQKNFDAARTIFDQLFMSTASGRYLDHRTSDFGISRPDGVLLQDDPYRRLGLAVRNQQLTADAIWNLLEIFYGVEAVRATIDTGVAEPYALEDGDDIQIEFNRKLVVPVVFHRGDFARIGQATALEVSVAIARAVGQRGTSSPILDPDTGATHVRVLSGEIGLGSTIAIVGGRAQTKLRFSQSLFQTSGSSPFATWDIAPSPTPGNVRFTLVSGIFDVSKLEVGDLAYIYGTEFANTGSVGTFAIADVNVTFGMSATAWFEIANPSATSTTSGVHQSLFRDLMFFRPVRRTLHDQVRSVVVGKSVDSVNVVLPATTLIVERGLGLAAYPPDRAPLALASVVRSSGVVTATTAAPHGLSAGDWVSVDGVVPTNTPPPVIAGTASGNYSANTASGTTGRSLGSTSSETHTFQAVDHQAVRLLDGSVYVVGGNVQTGPSTKTQILSPTVLSVTADDVIPGDGRRVSYRWTNLVSRTHTIGLRDFATSVLLDGRLLASGGTNGDDITGAAVATWDLFTYSVSPPLDSQTSGTLAAARSAHAQASLPDGRAIAFGGRTTPGIPVATTIAFDPLILDWFNVGSLHVPRMRHGAASLPSGRVLAIGGQNATGAAIASCEVYDFGSDTWALTGGMARARYWFGHATLPSGRILVVGGQGRVASTQDADAPLRECEVYDPATGWWSPAPPTSVARIRPIVCYLPADNLVVVAGGGSTVVELLDVTAMTWSRSLAPLATGLSGSSGDRLGTDAIVVVGGTNGTTSPKLNYLFVPGQERVWSGGLNRPVPLVAASGTSLSYDTAGDGYSGTYSAPRVANATVTPIGATVGTIPGPYTFDRSGVSVTGTASPLVTDLLSGHRYQTIDVNATAFPDTDGYLVLDFGSDSAVGPLHYFGRQSANALVVDASFVFPRDVQAGTTVTLLRDRSAFVPDSGARIGSCYVTGSTAGRLAAQSAVTGAVAAGVQLDVHIEYPGDSGLGNEGRPSRGINKITDAVEVWGGDEVDTEIATARETP